MTYYRLYFLRGSRIQRVEEIDAPSDMAAMEAARAHVGEDGLELWQESRKIGRIEPNDLGSQLIAQRRAHRDAATDAAVDQSKAG